jgi:probable addiction module antidote protein
MELYKNPKKNEDGSSEIGQLKNGEKLYKFTDEFYDNLDYKNLKDDVSKIVEYEKFIIKEYRKTQDLKWFFRKLTILVKAKGFSNISKKTGMSRRTIYNTLESENIPRLDTFINILNAVDVKLDFKINSHIIS